MSKGPHIEVERWPECGVGTGECIRERMTDRFTRDRDRGIGCSSEREGCHKIPEGDVRLVSWYYQVQPDVVRLLRDNIWERYFRVR